MSLLNIVERKVDPDITVLEVTGRLERREGTINLLAASIVPLGRPGRAEIGPAPAEQQDIGELRAAAPHANSFGRGRR